MNQNYTFPRKKPQVEQLNFLQSNFIRNVPGHSTYRNNRRYKSHESTSKYLFSENNKYTLKPLNNNYGPREELSTDSVRKNRKIMQKSFNFNHPERLNKFKINLNQNIIKKNLKKLGKKSSHRKKRLLTDTIQSHSSMRKVKSTHRESSSLNKGYIVNQQFNI